MRKFGSLSAAMFKGFFRDRVAVFFTFLFPLMFLVVFGLIFGGNEASKLPIGVVGDGPIIRALPADVVEVQRFDSLEAGVEKVRAGDLPAVIAEQGDEVVMRFAASDRTGAGTALGLVNGVVSEANVAESGGPPRFSLRAEQVEDASLKPIQYLTPGLLSWSVATSAVFGSATMLVSWRRRQVLRRLWLAPTSAMSVLTSRLGVALVVALLQATLFVLLAITPVFGLRLSGAWLLAVPLLAIGTLAFFAVGMLAGSFAKTEEAANAVSNLIVLPMAFLAGAFFPLEGSPGWLQTISQALPLRHLNEGMLDVMVRDQGADALIAPVAVLLGFTVVVGALAFRLFRWDDA